MRVVLDHNPLAPGGKPIVEQFATLGQLPAWIAPTQPILPPEVTAYRLRFALLHDAIVRVHVSADERYQFFVDGQRVGRGPERGSDRIWFFETYDLDLAAGEHVFVALVWRLGDIGPLAQVGIVGGFLLEAEGPQAERLSTRCAPWEAKPVLGLRFHRPGTLWAETACFVEPVQTTDATHYPWGVEQGEGEGWAATVRRPEEAGHLFGRQAEHRLHPAMLPAQVSAVRTGGRVRHVAEGVWDDPQAIFVNATAHLPAEVAAWQAFLERSEPLTLPPHTRRQVVIDLETYVCAYPQLKVSGGRGGQITVGWAEALYKDAAGKDKGQRDEVDGRFFVALCRDSFLPDGCERRGFEPLWWRAGRYLELLVESTDQPLTLESLRLLETRYPLELESRFSSSDARLEGVTPLALRGLQMCAHETYMDCPYYEQMMYVGDTRLEALTHYAISSDDRLARKAVRLFGLSRLPDGLTQARYPGRDQQIIPPFALWWIGMVYDYALWRGDLAFIREQMPGVRAVLDGFLSHVHASELLPSPAGWNFSDWVPDWPLGVPPGGFEGFSGLLNWHLVYTLDLATRLEDWAGERELALCRRNQRDRLARAVTAAFWDEARGLFADDLEHKHFSEHTQCLALLSGALAGDRLQRTGKNLLTDSTLTRTTIYFTHYVFETYRLLERPDALLERLSLWFDLSAHGFKTTPESPEPARSDCHGWGAHPLYHYFASLLGVRPIGFGFERVEIAPQPGHLTSLSGVLAHPKGPIEVTLDWGAGRLSGRVSLPAGVSGIFRYAGGSLVLYPGMQKVDL